MTNQELAQKVLNAVGGSENVKSVINCATRLRFTLRDDSIPNDEEVKDIDGVYGVIRQGGLYQVVIGSAVSKVYTELTKYLTDTGAEVAVPEKKITAQSIVSNIFGYISSVGGGLAVPLIATGMIKVILTVLTLLGIMPKDSQMYQMLFFVADCCFYFLPVFVAIGASRKLGTDIYMTILVSLMVLHPTWSSIVGAGEAFKLLGINIPLTNYTSSFMPMLLTIYVLSWVEKGVNKIVPKMIKSLLSPVLTLLIMIPITFCVTGPIGYMIGKGLADIFLAMQTRMGPAFVGILAFSLPLLILCGLHQSLGSVFITTYISAVGYDGPWGPANLCVNVSIFATCLALSILTNKGDSKFKTMATSAGITAGFGGITEPAIFGVLIKDKKYLLTACASAGIAGFFSAVIGLRRYVIASPNLLSLPVFIGEGSGLINAVIVALIAAVCAFILTYVTNKMTKNK